MLRVFKSNKGKFRTFDECYSLWENAGINELCSLRDYLTYQYTELAEGMVVVDFDRGGPIGKISGFSDDSVLVELNSGKIETFDIESLNHMEVWTK